MSGAEHHNAKVAADAWLQSVNDAIGRARRGIEETTSALSRAWWRAGVRTALRGTERDLATAARLVTYARSEVRDEQVAANDAKAQARKHLFQLDERNNIRTCHVAGVTVVVWPGQPRVVEIDTSGEDGLSLAGDDEVRALANTLTAATFLSPLDPPPPAGPVEVTATAPAPDGWLDDGRPVWTIHDDSGDHDDGREGETHTVQVDPDGQVRFDGQPVVLGEQVGAAILAAARWTSGEGRG